MPPEFQMHRQLPPQWLPATGSVAPVYPHLPPDGRRIPGTPHRRYAATLTRKKPVTVPVESACRDDSLPPPCGYDPSPPDVYARQTVLGILPILHFQALAALLQHR